ncbi:MAG TPA: hypothetical protein VJM32_04690 [Candidatus Saccharimonadales bacterium]|nr:hypothetical protein [Candidatus Saccharimonadales bacterium]
MNILPVVFADGSDFYKALASTYITHRKGLFILAPSGAGKTYFCQNQSSKHWIDGDELWFGAKAHPEGPWWKEPVSVMRRVDQRCDVLTSEAMEQGFWIMGASNQWLKPSAIVIPEWEAHKENIRKREQTNYDGGATAADFDQVLGHMEWIKKWHTEHGVPMFATIEAAVEALTPDSM